MLPSSVTCIVLPHADPAYARVSPQASPYSTADIAVLSSLRMDYDGASQAWCEYVRVERSSPED